MNCVKEREALSNSYMKVLAQTHNFIEFLLVLVS